MKYLAKSLKKERERIKENVVYIKQTFKSIITLLHNRVKSLRK